MPLLIQAKLRKTSNPKVEGAHNKERSQGFMILRLKYYDAMQSNISAVQLSEPGSLRLEDKMCRKSNTQSPPGFLLTDFHQNPPKCNVLNSLISKVHKY